MPTRTEWWAKYDEITRRTFHNTTEDCIKTDNSSIPLEEFMSAHDQLMSLMKANADKIRPGVWQYLLRGTASGLTILRRIEECPALPDPLTT